MDDRPGLFFFCDTNLAVYDTHLFAKQGGLQVVRLIRELRGQIALPGISRSEYLSNFASVSAKAHKDAEKALSVLQTLSGRRLMDALPHDKFWESRGLQVLEGLKDIACELVATEALKAAAMDRALEGRKPARGPNQDFKDCLIWECILSLPQGSEIIFASRDSKAFYREGKFDESLLKEAEAKELRITPVDTVRQDLWEAVEVLKSRVADVDSLRLNELRFEDSLLEPEPVVDSGPALPVILPNAVAVTLAEQAAEKQEDFDPIGPARDFFQSLEQRALGVVSYLGRAGKQEAIGLLVQSGASVDAARNVLERLALAGMIRDTGHNYLRVDGPHSQRAAELVEETMIKLTGLGG